MLALPRDTWVQWWGGRECEWQGNQAPRGQPPLPLVCLACWPWLWAARRQSRGLFSRLLFALCLQELFKGFARHLSHSLAQRSSLGGSGECLHRLAGGTWGFCREETGPHVPPPGSVVKEEAQNLIKRFFHGRARCESEADWNSLCDPQT